MRILLFFILLIPFDMSHDILISKVESPKVIIKTLSQRELKCLVDNAFYEARGEGDLGMLLVTKVVINRAKQKNESYCNIIYKRNQFSWTTMKNLRNIPDHTRIKIENLMLMIHHGSADNIIPQHLSYALFYHADHVKPVWFKTRKKLGKFGNHIFYI